MIITIQRGLLLLVLTIALSVVVLFPTRTNAAQEAVQWTFSNLFGGGGSALNLGNAADALCVKQCFALTQLKPPQSCPQTVIACQVTTSGGTAFGLCMPNGCKGKSFSGTGGSGNVGTDILKQALGTLFQKLMSGGEKGGSGSGSTPATAPTTGTTGCAQYYNVTTPTTDPCAIYVAPVSASIDTGSNSSAVSEYLNQNTEGDSTNTDTSINTNTDTNTNQLTVQVSTVTTTTDEPTSATQVIVPQGAIGGLTSGVSGDVQTLGISGTILAGSVDAKNNSVTAGFYGGESFNGQPQGAISGLCQNRPWASNFISYVLPATFFDSLCTLRGYQVGQPVKTPAPVVTVTQTKAAPVTQVQTTNTVLSNVAPKVSIWAAPATVPLGSRTSIFWNSQGVTNCIETSPDGAFAQNSLSGGASTVAITGSTVFSISCITPNGSHITDSVTVDLSI